MDYGSIPGIEKPVSRLVQGTGMVGSKDEARWFDLLDAVYELGCTTFDTAHIYGYGDNERTVGRWVRQRNIRDQVVIIGKGAHFNEDRQRVTPFDITADLHDSLARFQFEAIDLYLLHRDAPDVPIGPIVDVLNEHLEAGRIRAFGGSNWTHRRLQEANAYARAHNLVPFVASSPHFSLVELVEGGWPGLVSIAGPAGRSAREWYAASQMPLLPWSSLASGFLSGRYSREDAASAAGGPSKACLKSFGSADNFRRLDRARTLAQEKGLSIPQVAMAYLMNQGLNIFPLVGSKAPQHFEANMRAMSIRLTDAEISWLDLTQDER
jgi:aryl-alcohol dehydrogenase-like predicted oxidoreductase